MALDAAEVFPLGDYLKKEMEERGWSAEWLADRCPWITVERANSILSGRGTPLSINEARDLGDLFGVSPALFLRIDGKWQGWVKRRVGLPPTLEDLRAYVATLGEGCRKIYETADALALVIDDTLSEDFQVACAVLEVFRARVGGNDRGG